MLTLKTQIKKIKQLKEELVELKVESQRQCNLYDEADERVNLAEDFISGLSGLDNKDKRDKSDSKLESHIYDWQSTWEDVRDEADDKIGELDDQRDDKETEIYLEEKILKFLRKNAKRTAKNRLSGQALLDAIEKHIKETRHF